ncbi:MAG: histidinol-phosphate transaminase [Cyanobacteria bacterium J06573_11]
MAFLRSDLAQFAAYSAPHPDPHSDQQAPEKKIDGLDTNESPIDLPPALKAALAQQYEQIIEANRYPDGSHAELNQAIAQYAIASSNIAPETLTLKNITLGNGSDELIRSLIMATCLGGEGAILVSDPTFSMYAILAKTLGVPVHTVSRKENFEVDIAQAEVAIDTAQKEGSAPVKVIFMVHPNSPTGNALTQLELDWLKQLSTDILIVVDEAYFEFSGHTTLAEALSRPNWIVTRTFSKAFRLAAHRVGYGIAHPSIIAALEKLRLPYNLPTFSQAAALTALGHSEQLLEQIPTILDERNKLLHRLSEHDCLRVWPSDSNFIYARLSDRGLSTLGVSEQADGLKKVFQQLRSRGTIIRHTGGGLRISIGTPPENQRTLSNIQSVLSKESNTTIEPVAATLSH